MVVRLQAVSAEAYTVAAYGRTLDHARPPEPPLEGSDATRAAKRLRARDTPSEAGRQA